jgi:hypothetical protein
VGGAANAAPVHSPINNATAGHNALIIGLEPFFCSFLKKRTKKLLR